MFRILRERPLFTLCLFFTATYLILIRCFSGEAGLYLSILIPVGALLTLFKKFYPIGARYIPLFPLIMILFGIGLAGISVFVRSNIWITPANRLAGKECTVSARVNDINYQNSFSSSFYVTVMSVDGEETSVDAVLDFPYSYDAGVSDILTGDVRFSLPDEMSGMFPLRSYYLSDGILLTAKPLDDAVISCEGGSETIFDKAGKLSAHLSARLRLLLGDEVGGFASGLFLGKRDEVPDSVKRDFSVLGISHLLAVSGLHLSIIIGVLELLLRMLGVGRIAKLTIHTSAMLTMLFLTGFPASCVRASIMTLFVLVALCLGEQSDALTSLGIASVLILMIFRGAAWDAGFLLSVSATFGILTFGVGLNRKLTAHIGSGSIIKDLLRRTVSLVVMSVSALIFTLPVVWLYFGQVSILSPVTNIIFIPAATVMLCCVVILAVISGTPWAAGMSFCVKSVGGFIINIASRLARISPDTFSLRYPFVKYAFIAAGAVFLLLMIVFFRKPHLLISVTVTLTVFVITVFAGYYFSDVDEEISVIAVNRLKNDFILIQSGGETMICDISDGTLTSPKAASEVVNYQMFDTSVDTLYISHLHSKHVSTFSYIADNTHLKRLIIPDHENGDENDDKAVALLLKEAAEERNIEVVTYKPDIAVTVGEVSITRSELSYIKRSVQPIFYLSFDISGRHMVYAEAGVTESELYEEFDTAVLRSETVLIGIHGPNIKQSFDIPKAWVDERVSVLVTADEVNEGFGTDITDIGGDEIASKKII